ncbi:MULTISPECIES: hypothetical protein [unclassified Acidisoma]|jgi:hypothetical protein|uniref:hypothetical protein n=1 Tax=unclassified Acidisoma TaxID=2634065 RepID=UPI00131D2AB4|nr:MULTISPECIES: hypothetical protein [unclassified Acidisoma]
MAAAGGWRLAGAMLVAFTLGGLGVTAVAEESHVAQALEALDDAHDALAATRDNKGGHPAAAIALIASAKAELSAVSQ